MQQHIGHISRRDFLRGSATGIAALGAQVLWGSGAAAHDERNDPRFEARSSFDELQQEVTALAVEDPAVVGSWSGPYASGGFIPIHQTVLATGRVLTWGRTATRPYIVDPTRVIPATSPNLPRFATTRGAALGFRPFCGLNLHHPAGGVLQLGGYNPITNGGTPDAVLLGDAGQILTRYGNMNDPR